MLFEQIPFDSRTFVRGYSCAEKERKANLVTLHEALIILDDKRDVSIFVHFGPGLAGTFGALLVGWLAVVARAVSRKTPIYFIILNQPQTKFVF